MSFGSGGFSFGGNNNTQSAFGGFGSNNNTNTNTGFGANTGSAFGASTNNPTQFGGSAFGSSSGGFGNTNNSTSLFGNKPASNPFGASTNSGTGLFGNSTNTNTGGFGASTGGFGTNNTSAFGSNNNAASSFSFGSNANKPAFGNTTSSTPLFGQGGSGTTSGFGSTNAFGSGTALSNQPVPPSDGTASTPFAPHVEKDGTGPTSSAYQSIVFQQPYQKYSFEELRLADYNAGRRYGNNTGQAGGFGGNTFGGFGSTNTNTGGFGSSNTGGGLFGNNAASSSTGFGSNTATTGFGGGGLFGNKPATGGLFGSQSTGTTTGGLFGTSNNTATPGFGSGSTGTGLFGNNQQNQNKPSPFGATTTTPSFSFGNTNANQTAPGTTGGLFGNTQQANQSSGGLFGNNQQQSGGLFGNNNNQQKPLFGTSTGGFGTSTTPNQTGGLFGNANTQNTGGGLFGGNNNNQQSNSTGTGLFGSTTNTSGGLFGGNNNANNAQKPGGLFGSSFGNTNTANTGGGLFSNTNTNQQQSGGLFNNANTNTNSGFSFGMGNSTNKPASTGLFGNASTNQSGGLFGGSSFGGLGASQNNQQNAQQQSDFRVSSLNDPNPYGQTSIWTGLPVPTPDNSKPIFTPLSASQKLKESQSKPPPSLRLNQSRYMTPPRRPGFGFSYSTYGTPNSAASTPGGGSLSNSMYGNRSFNGSSFGGSVGRSFGKSASVTNLRSQFNVGDSDSVLSPNAFNPSHTRWSGGNMRRLTIDRSIRNDLFSRQSLPALAPPSPAEKNVNGKPDSSTANGELPAEPTKLRKRVSFDKEITGGQNGTLNGETGALVRTETDDDTPEPEPRGRAVNGTATPDAQQVRGNELAVVPEDRASDHVSPKKTAVEAKPDPQPGDYWMKPTRAQISKLPREKAQEFVGFEVGRKGCGRVTFLGAVDLTALPLDDLYEKIVEIRLRSVTVYPDSSSKPPVGKGLNVPSMIHIENSWPRARGQPSSATSGPIFDKHVNRLKKMQGTEFMNYDVATGVWTFKVPHYTRYGLDYDDDDDLSRSQISLPPDSLTGSRSENASGMEVDSEENDDYDENEDEDDTFAFKQKTIPGGYGKRSVIDDYDLGAPTAQELEDGPESDLEEYESEDTDNEVSMVGSFPAPAIIESPNKPILKASRMGTPGKALISLEGDWAEQLQRTISPRKQNREALRDVQNKVLLDRAFEPIKPRAIAKDQLNTSIDIMNSLFSKHEERMTKGRKGQAGPDFEFPYAKRAKTFDDESELTQHDKSWHASFKPHFTATNGLIYKSNGEGDHVQTGWNTEILVADSHGRNVVALTSLQGSPDHTTSGTMDVESLLADAHVVELDGVPFIEHHAVPFSQTKGRLAQQHTSQTELDIYELAHVLFDDYEDEFAFGLSRQQQQEYISNIRKDRLSKYLSALIWRRHGDRIKASEKSTAATAAILYLTAKNIKAACDVLMKEKDFHLTLLVAQIDSADDTVQQDINDQLSAWREQGVISEMSEEIRALYEIIAGNTGVCQGKQNVPVENRASTFSISEKFDLDWIQAFALSLWYGRQKSHAIQDAVKDFQDQLTSQEESASPMDARGNEDPLWVLLRLFATQAKGNVSGLEKPIFPQALSILANHWNSQSIFRLHNAIVSTVSRVNVDHGKAEELAGSLAFEFSARGDVVGATYALLHVGDPLVRTKYVKELLNKHAAGLSDSPKNGMGNQLQKNLFGILEQSLGIPATWLYAAKALYARSANDSLAELLYQILAKDFSAAHETLLRRVAPRLVIDEDWTALSDILKQFGDNPEEHIGAVAWSEGGGVYEAFVALMGLEESNMARSSQAEKVERNVVLQRLQKTLTTLNSKETNLGPLGKDKEKIEERVALREMGRAVAAVLKDEAEGERTLLEKKSILDLPLTADARLSHATALGVDYYRGVMAMAR